MHTSLSVRKLARVSPGSRHPGGVGGALRAPHPAIVASRVFRERVAAVVQLSTAFVKSENV